MLKKNKADITLEFIIVTIIALVIFSFVVVKGFSYLKFNDKETISYYSLIDLLNNAKLAKDDMKSIPFYLNKDSSIIGFNKDAKKVYMSANYLENTDGTEPSPAGYHIAIERPVKCKEGKPCLCLCSKKSNLDFTEQILTCKDSMRCTSLNDIEFAEPDEASFGAPAGINGYSFKGGFFFSNAKKLSVLPKVKENPFTLYVSKSDKGILICLKYPCKLEEKSQQTKPST